MIGNGEVFPARQARSPRAQVSEGLHTPQGPVISTLCWRRV